MPDRRPLVAGNWKLNGSRSSNGQLLDGILTGLPPAGSVETIVCPPFVYLADVAARLAGSPVGLGAQNLAVEPAGVFTGEVSADMLRDVGCTHVIVGHSERRSLYGESDALVAAKVGAALGGALTPIICVGETLAEREAGRTAEVVARQVEAVLKQVGAEGLGRGVIAYEPVWAIGTGRTATPEQAQEVHAHIRGIVRVHDATIARGLRILYGGSVKGANAGELFACPDIDGGLIGGASLKADEFLAICRAATG